MAYKPYNIKVECFCIDDNDARETQAIVSAMVRELKQKNVVLTSDVVKKYTPFIERNLDTLIAVISDVADNGIMSVMKHLSKLTKLK